MPLKDNQTYGKNHVPKYLPVEEHIAAVRKAAAGLENPRVDVEVDEDYGSYTANIYVEGVRDMTSEELEQRRAEKRREEEWEREQLSRLLDKYGKEK